MHWQGESTSEQAKAWTRVRASLRESAGARLFDQWLKPMELVESDETDAVRLALPSAFMTNWVRSHYADRLQFEFRQHLPGLRSVVVETRAPRPQPAALTAGAVLSAAPVSVDASPPVVPPAAVVASPTVAAERPQLDMRYTFDRFVVDQANRVAFNAARALAEPGVPRFSPLFLHSGTGQGKTHLMHAIAHTFLEAQPN
ncbi:MAG: chromosomal replication initiator protein DnaA, partial [Sphingomonas sp.]